MRRLATAAQRVVRRSRFGRGAYWPRAALAVAVGLLVGAALVVRVRSPAPPLAPRPPRAPGPRAVARIAFPPYTVTRTPEAARACYLPGDTGVVALDTVATASGVVVVAVAVARDRTTEAYVEARQIHGAEVACLGRVVRAAAGWDAYVSRMDSALGLVDRVLGDATGAGRPYPDRHAAATAVERSARGAVARVRRAGATP